MHVLITADTVGGVWTYARELVTGLVRRGVQVTLVSFGEIPAPGQADWLEGLRDVNFLPTAFRLEWMQEAPDELPQSFDYLQSVIDDVQPDLLHLNQFCYGALDVSIPKLVVAHSDVVSWWVNVRNEEPPNDEWTRWYRATVEAGLNGADWVVAPSRWMLGCVEAYYGTPRYSSVVYNGRSPNLFNPHITKEDYAVSVGRLWDGGKQAVLLTQVEDFDAPIYIAGAEQHADERLRGDTGLSQATNARLHIKGPQSEGQLRQLFGRAAIYAATSRYEPFGLAPLEAALSRCAIVANDIPSFREIWGETAIYFRRDDAKSLSRELARLHRDRELRLTYANLAYNRARIRYTAERMVDNYMELYQALVSRGVAAA